MIAVLPALVVAVPDVRVVDGDTLVIAGEHVRIAGINAADPVGGHSCTMRPRWRFAWCDDAAAAAGTAYARRFVEVAGPVTAVARLGCDRYGRTVARVRFGEVDFGAVMVAAGLARVVPATAGACPAVVGQGR